MNNQNGSAPDAPRVVVFIDGSNLYHSLEENCGRADLDFELFVHKLAGERTLFRTYYYNIVQDAERRPEQHKEQQKFLASLYAVPRMDLRLGTQKMRGDQLVEKGVDIMLATDLLRFAWEDMYDVAILVSGDADFHLRGLDGEEPRQARRGRRFPEQSGDGPSERRRRPPLPRYRLLQGPVGGFETALGPRWPAAQAPAVGLAAIRLRGGVLRLDP